MTQISRSPIPVRPAPPAPSGAHFVRACFAVAQGRVNRSDPAGFVGRNDVARHIVERATAPLGTTTTVGFAAELARTAFGDFLRELGPYGAAARLIAQAVPAAVGTAAEVHYPVRSAAPVSPAWVAEGGAIPVRCSAFDLITIGPARKMAHILAWSYELGKRSDAERIFRTMLAEDVAAGLDAALLATTAASSAAPAGLLYGVTPIAGYGGGDTVALKTDLVALAVAVATGGSGAATFIMAPARLARLRILAPELSRSLDLVASAVVPADRVVAVDGPGLLIATDPAPDIQRSEQATVHMSDVPLEIVSDAPVVSDPVRSLWQTASVALRVIHELAFEKRRAGAVAYLDGATW